MLVLLLSVVAYNNVTRIFQNFDVIIFLNALIVCCEGELPFADITDYYPVFCILS